MPILSSCCICLDLKVGTKIIGVLTLIGSLINSIVMAGVVVMVVIMGIGTNVVNEISKSSSQPTVDYDDDYVDVREEKGVPILEMVMNHIQSVTIVLYVLLAVLILSVITSSMLIHGVKHNRRGLLIPYLLQELINIIVITALIIWALVVFGSPMPIVSSVLGMAGAGLVHIYFALVVFSQYQALGLIRMHEEISMK